MKQLQLFDRRTMKAGAAACILTRKQIVKLALAGYEHRQQVRVESRRRNGRPVQEEMFR